MDLATPACLFSYPAAGLDYVLYPCLMTIDKQIRDGVPALRTECLGRRYGKVWGLRDCTLEVPAGAVAALVGPNGAGKTTLMEMIIGLLEPTEGSVSVFGEASPVAASATLAQVGYVAQDHPLYRDFTVADMFRLGRAMNPRWDQKLAQARMDGLAGQAKPARACGVGLFASD